MKIHGRTLLALTGLAATLAGIGALALPTTAAAFTLLGGSLNTTQRDFRVFNNFGDASANNNTTPHVNFPGNTGAVMAIWKGHGEWASEPIAGNGLGDGIASNPVIGSGNANFDNIFQGTATSAGTNNANIHSEIPGSDGGVLAFTISPISDGWTIKYYAGWTWQDGPNSVTTGVDLQGVACHEIGHSLGLNHSTAAGNPTMAAFITGTGTGQRSIETDDALGVQAIYGVKSGSKPHISSIAGTKQIGQALTISGSDFAATGGEVWFTKANSDGVPTKVTNVSSTGGGTSITVTIPSGVQDGEVMVKNAGLTNSSLSNAYPIDIGGQSGDPPLVSTVDPTQGPAGGFTQVTITGGGFNGTTSVRFNLTDALDFTVDSNTQITATAPAGPLFGFADITVTDPDGASTLPFAYFWTFNPVVDISDITPSSGPLAGGTPVTITGGSVVGVTSVTFGGVAGTQLELVSPTELTVVTPAGSPGAVDVVAIGDSSSTLPGGFTYMDEGSFTEFGTGIPGILGVAPQLSGAGDLTPGSGTGFMLLTSAAVPSAPAVMFVSLAQASLPFKGGTLYAFPIVLSISLATSVAGTINLPAQIPVGTPGGASFYLQTWVQDAGAVSGLASTNGLAVTTP
jgi:hypothetical protein